MGAAPRGQHQAAPSWAPWGRRAVSAGQVALAIQGRSLLLSQQAESCVVLLWHKVYWSLPQSPATQRNYQGSRGS